jgi:hypothetical protein
MTPDAEKRVWSKINFNEVHARCDCCGFTWKLYRGDAFVCPFCYNSPDDVDVSTGFVKLREQPEEWSAWRR